MTNLAIISIDFFGSFPTLALGTPAEGLISWNAKESAEVRIGRSFTFTERKRLFGYSFSMISLEVDRN